MQCSEKSVEGRLYRARQFLRQRLSHLLAWAIQQELTVATALQLPVYHPVLGEGLRTALRRLAGDTDLNIREVLPNCLDCG